MTRLSQLGNPRSDYPAIRDAAVNLLAGDHLNDILPATYDRLFVDEYQDCSLVQHALAVGIAETLPACVLGEPLYDDAGLPRVLQVHELLDHLTAGKVPTESMVPLLKQVRNMKFEGVWH